MAWRVPSPSAPADSYWYWIDAEPGNRLGLGASTSTRDVGMPFVVVCPFPTSTVSLVNINAFGAQSTRPPLIHRAPHASHSGFHVYCMS